MLTLRPVALMSLLTAVAPASTLAQVSVNGARFEDLGATTTAIPTPRISLGSPRGSIAVIDYDNDGYYDLFTNDNGGSIKRLYHNVPSSTVPGGRAFVDVSAAAGLTTMASLTSRGAGAVLVFDYNNDGFDDIYTAGTGQSGTAAGILLRNNGNGTFTDVSDAAGIRSPLGVTPDSASAIDFNHDGFIDIFIDNVSSPSQTFTLLLNNGNGTFTNRSNLVSQPGFGGRIYASGFADLDRDGWEDHIALLNNGVGLVLRNVAAPGGGRTLTALTAAQSGMSYLGPAPMGIAVGDYDGDGWLDLAITDASSGTYYRNLGAAPGNHAMLERITPYATFFGWGTTWLDTTNKGRLDNYQAGSYGGANIDHLRINNANGTWTDARNALNTTPLASQHCARVDFDNDGLEDILTNNPGRFISVYHNAAPAAGHWLKLKLTGTLPGQSAAAINRSAIGAVVRVTAGGVTQVREIVSGSSFGSSEDPRAHFGLGSAAVVDRIEILWPRAGEIASRTQVLTGPIPVDVILSIAPDRPARCSPADIADNTGEPLPPFGNGGFNPGVDEGDFNCFFNFYFEPSPTNAVCDFADGLGDPLPPFNSTPPGFNPGVDGGDFDCFFNFYFNGCP